MFRTAWIFLTIGVRLLNSCDMIIENNVGLLFAEWRFRKTRLYVVW